VKRKRKKITSLNSSNNYFYAFKFKCKFGGVLQKNKRRRKMTGGGMKRKEKSVKN
jgi:hypothetical protein